jgi:hypothetical protein
MKRSYGSVSPARQPGLALRGIDGGDHLLGALLDAAIGEPIPEHLRYSRGHGDGALHREGHRHLHRLADALLREVLVQEERALERRRRALERLPEYGEEDPPAVEGIQGLAHPFSAGERVVLESAFEEAGGRANVVVRTESHDEEVRVV